jgi:hypothetical protein
MKQHAIELEAEEHQIKDASNRQLQNLYKKAGVQQKELKNEIFKKILDKQIINKTLVSLIVIQNLFFQAIK